MSETFSSAVIDFAAGQRTRAIREAAEKERAAGVHWPRAVPRIFYHDESGRMRVISAADRDEKKAVALPYDCEDDGA